MMAFGMTDIADKVQDFDCVIRMYEIVFTKKQKTSACVMLSSLELASYCNC